MDKWRPEGWQKNKDEWYRNSAHGQILDGVVYEAGADAMLEALKEKGAWMTPGQMKLLAPDRKYPYGYIVFIPEEKQVPVSEVSEQKEVPKVIKTEKDVDEVAKFIKAALKKAQEAGQEGINIVHQFTPDIPVFKLTLEEAAHRAERFLEDLAGQHFYRLKNIEQEGNIWRVQYDIGILKKRIVEVVIDDKTGEVKNYELLPEPGKTKIS